MLRVKGLEGKEKDERGPVASCREEDKISFCIYFLGESEGFGYVCFLGEVIGTKKYYVTEEKRHEREIA